MPIWIPLYLTPVLGYAQHHLARGRTRAQVAAQIKSTTRFGHLSDDDIATATQLARESLVALTRLAGPRTGRTFVDAFRGQVEPGEIIGLRVKMAGTMASGRHEVFSVSVNAPAHVNPGDVIAFVIDWAISGGLAARGRGTEPVEIDHAEIVSLQRYAFRSPTLHF